VKKIAIEEHFRTDNYINHLKTRKEYPKLEVTRDDKGQETWREWSADGEYQLWIPRAITRLCDIGEGRIKEMDDAGVDMQVLGFPPGVEMFSAAEGTALVRQINDDVAAAVRKHPDRFTALAALPLKDPKAAADELERAVKKLGLKGAMIFPHVAGEYIDHKKYWPIFETAAKLGVPLYVHPTHPPVERQKQYTDYPELSGSLWAFAAETGLGAMRLICSGIFDTYPSLQIILGHLGEALPFWMWRLDNRMLRSSVTVMSSQKMEGGGGFVPLAKTLKKLPSHYLKENFYVTTSGMLWQPALICTILALGADRIMFAVDYPMEPSQEAVQFMEAAAVSDSDKEKIYHLNAEKLFGL